jgi:predicted nucleic acid-binding Zn ribbon protein
MWDNEADRQSETLPLSAVLERFYTRLDPEGVRNTTRYLPKIWKEMVGAEVAAITDSVTLRGTELIVRLSSSAWAHELGFLEDNYRERLNETLGSDVIKRIRYQVVTV